MLKSILKFNALFLLLAFVTLTSCEKEEVISAEEPLLTEDFTVTERGVVLGPRGDRLQCYQLLFPVAIAVPGQDAIEVADAEALKQLLMQWRENNRNATEHPRIAFPYEVELQDGTIATIETIEDVQELRQDCRVSRPHRPAKCFRLIYPVTVNLPNGNTEEAGSAEALHEIFKTWKEENPDATERPELAFPYQVQLRNGGVITIESGIDVRDLPRGCHDRPQPPCYQLIYPLTLVFPGADGITVEVADVLAMHRVLGEWRENYPNAEGRPEILFPYEVRLRNGTIATIENEEDLQEATDNCQRDRPYRPKCFRRTFPLTLEYPDGRQVDVENRVELHLRLWNWKRNNPDATERPKIAFPFTVELRDGTTLTISNEEELEALRDRCGQ